jgi:hypothetical protein
MMPAERARTVIEAAHAAGVRVYRNGRKVLMAAPTKPPDELIRRIRAARPELLGYFAGEAERTDWRRWYGEALAHHRALHPKAEAAGLAWSDLQNRWHRHYGTRGSEWRCAGCAGAIGGFKALDLGDGNRVHFGGDYGSECLIAYGRRWRGAASRALEAMGLQPPADDDEADAGRQGQDIQDISVSRRAAS